MRHQFFKCFPKALKTYICFNYLKNKVSLHVTSSTLIFVFLEKLDRFYCHIISLLSVPGWKFPFISYCFYFAACTYIMSRGDSWVTTLHDRS